RTPRKGNVYAAGDQACFKDQPDTAVPLYDGPAATGIYLPDGRPCEPWVQLPYQLLGRLRCIKEPHPDGAAKTAGQPGSGNGNAVISIGRHGTPGNTTGTPPERQSPQKHCKMPAGVPCSEKMCMGKEKSNRMIIKVSRP